MAPPTRKASTDQRAAVEKLTTKANKLRRATFETTIRNSIIEIQDPSFAEFSLAQVQDGLSQAELKFQAFENEHLLIISELEESDDFTPHQTLYTEVMNIYNKIRRILCARIAELTPAPEPHIAENVGNANPQAIVVRTTTDVSQMKNTWGTFAGDYTKWSSFRDRFKQAVHDNEEVPTMLKFQWLMEAAQGEAARAMGQWKLEIPNYIRAWNQLTQVYEDDYLAVQTLVRRLLTIPRMDVPTYKGIRRIIDTVNECTQQLSNFVPTDQWDPITVFMAIDLMDNTTYDAWEQHRQKVDIEANDSTAMETEEQENATGGAVGGDANQVVGENNSSVSGSTQTKYSFHIPSWSQLRAFLETRARVIIHSERRDRSIANENQNRVRDGSQNSNRGGTKPKNFKQAKLQAPPKQRAPTGYPLCYMCNEDHPLYHCSDFRLLLLNARWDFVRSKHICANCLKATDHTANECTLAGCNKCPNAPKHNGLLCATKEANRRTAHLHAAQMDAQLQFPQPGGSGSVQPRPLGKGKSTSKNKN